MATRKTDLLPNVNFDNMLHRCQLCEKQYKHKQSLVAHMRLHKENYKCSKCGKCCPKRYILVAHESSCDKKDKTVCRVCKTEFHDLWAVNEHFKNVHSDQPIHECKTCGHIAKSPSELKRHQTTHSGAKLYKCEHCDRAYKSDVGLQAHMKIHEEKFKCKECGFYTTCLKMLERHEEIHKKEPVFKCLDCDDCFTDRSRLNEHVQNKHPECNPYECNICGKRFSCFDSRNKHYRCHSENEYKCSICGASFNTLSSYNIHLKCHEKYRTERHYGCFYCEDSFTDLFSLRNHISISHENHRTNKNNSKFYKCPKCIWSGGVSTLWDHYEDKHSTEIEKEDYKCNYCEDKFTVRKEYEKHLQGHTMESLPYTCKYCIKKFRSPTLCAQHILDAHGEKLELNLDDRVTKLERLVIEICGFESELDPDCQRNKEGQLVFICKQCGNRWYGCTALKMHYKLSKDCKQGQPPGNGEQEANDLVEVNQKLRSPQQMKMKDNEESDKSKLQFQEKDVDHHSNSVLYKEDINATFAQTSSHSVNNLNRNIELTVLPLAVAAYNYMQTHKSCLIIWCKKLESDLVNLLLLNPRRTFICVFGNNQLSQTRSMLKMVSDLKVTNISSEDSEEIFVISLIHSSNNAFETKFSSIDELENKLISSTECERVVHFMRSSLFDSLKSLRRITSKQVLCNHIEHI